MEVVDFTKDIVVSGIKPSGEIHLGTLLGAILPFVHYQDIYNLYIFIADIHALTKPISAENLKKYTEDLIATYLAAGLDPNKITMFKQSEVYTHAQLSQILTCYLDVSDLTKMPQYKNYCETHKNKAVPAGMLDYVNWMNADILAYSPELNYKNNLKVICGQDQLPHIYSCQEVARRFNKIYGETFKLPEAVTAETGAKIMSLSNPNKKMSKSESDKGTIYLLDDINITRNKINKAVTDGEGKVYYDEINKPGISNLINILACLTNCSISEIENKYKNETDYRVFKKDVADCVCNYLTTLQARIQEIKSSNIITNTLQTGKIKALKKTEFLVQRVYKTIGLN